VAFEVDGVAYTYQSVQQTVYRLANGLLGLGLRKGDRIVIMTTNRMEYVFTDLAAAILGLVKVPLNVMLNNKDIDYRIRDSEARAVVLDDFFVKKTNLFFRTYDFLERIIYVPERDQSFRQDGSFQ
jgi:acyl-coenzyme A synthetase/AMP-(fatty) acid ligase